MEKKDMAPQNAEEIQDFLDATSRRHAEILEMLKEGKAHLVGLRDAKGNVKSYKIFAANGELLFYESFERSLDINTPNWMH